MLTQTTPSSYRSRRSWLQRLSPSSTNYVGIDIGVDYVKVATLGEKRDSVRSSRSSEIGWLSRAEFPLPIDPSVPPSPEWVDIVADVLEQRLPRCVDDEFNFAVLSLPATWIHYQTTPKAELGATKSQCDEMFGASIFQSDAHLSAWPAVGGKDHLVVAATADSAARQIADAVANTGYDVQGILPHGVALLMAAPALTSLTPWAVLLLERTGGMVAMRNELGCGMCRNLPACPIASDEPLFLDEIEPWLANIASEVEATQRYTSRLSGEQDKDSPILVCGRTAQMAGVDVALATVLGRPVATWRYGGRHRPSQSAPLLDPQHSDASMAVAISLACCSLQGKGQTGRPSG